MQAGTCSDEKEYLAADAKESIKDQKMNSKEERVSFEGSLPTTLEDLPSAITLRDRVANATALFLLVAVFIAAVVSIVAGACCLASLSDRSFGRIPPLMAVGVTPVVFGVFVLIASVAVAVLIIFCGMGIHRYGMCCAGGSTPMKVVNVCLLGVFPLCITVLMVALSVFAFSIYGLSRQVPPLDKDYTSVQGISGPVHILRDDNGLAHIKASSRRDALFGQGFAVAQDRLFQMEFYRLVGRGKLSSVVGAAGIETDKLLRVLNIRDSALSLCANSQASDLLLAKAFVDGINYYLKHVSQRPVEFFFMSLKSRPLHYHEPEPFTADDVCVVVRLLQFQMSYNFQQEIDHLNAFFTSAKRSYAQVESLFNNFAGVPATILTAEQLNMTAGEMKENIAKQTLSHQTEAQNYDAVLSQLRQAFAGGRSAAQSRQQLRAPQDVVRDAAQKILSEQFHIEASVDVFATKRIHASNGWAARDRMNRPIMASDPHLTIEFPSVWYSVHLSFPDEDGVQYDASGVCMVGLPGLQVGKTTYVSWAITMSATDLEDLFVIADLANPMRAPTNYTYRGKTRLFVPRRERITVRGDKDVVVDVEDTLFGPVVNDVIAAKVPPSVKLALYAVALRHDDTESLAALLSLSDPEVKTAQQLMNGLLNLRAPGFSIPIVDHNGNVAYAVTGRHPLRRMGHTGKYPSLALLLGNDSYVSDDPSVADDAVPTGSKPHLHSPADETPMHISAANQKIYPDGYAYELGFDFAWPYRGQRVQEMLTALSSEPGDQLSNITRHMAIQLDLRSNAWVQDYRPIVAGFDLATAGAAAQQWQTRLLGWDAQAKIGSVEASFFWRWLQSLSVLPLDMRGSDALQRYVWRMLTSPDALMATQCGLYAAQISVGSNATTCTKLAVALFVRLARTDFEERWGIDVHHLVGVHKLMHEQVFRPMFERSIEMEGDGSSVCVSHNEFTPQMESHQAASMRMLYDWSDPNRIYFAIPGGESGNPYSPYYENLLGKFGRGEFVRVVATAQGLDSMIVNRGARHLQTLFPLKK